jgi:carbonic anhydrase/acetyltransferase-like protein (isoleucine patch superfamily)
VVFRSTVGDNVKIGNKVLLDSCNIAPGTVIPDGTIMINNVVIGKIQW